MGKKAALLLISLFIFVFSGCDNDRGNNLFIGVMEEKKEVVSVGDFSRSDELSLINNIYHGLFEVQNENQVVPVLAESFSYSENGKKMFIKIREDMHWSDGTTITSENVLKGLENAIKGTGRYSYQYLYFDNKAEKTFLINEDGLLEIQLRKPFVDFEKILAMPIFYPVINESDPLEGPFSGNFIIEKNSKDRVALKPNPLANNEGILETESITFEYGIPPEELAKKYLEKEIDVIFAEKNLTELKGESVSVPAVRLLWFNGAKDELKNLEARRTITEDIDAGDIVKSLKNKEKELKGIYPEIYRTEPFLPKSNPLSDYEFVNNNLVLLILDGEQEALIAANIKEQLLKELALNIDIKAVGPEEYLNNLRNADFDLALETWEADYHGKNAFFELFVNPLQNPLNVSGIINVDVNSLQGQVVVTVDPEIRNQLFNELEHKIIEICPAVFISEGLEKDIYVQRVKNIKINTIYNYHDYSLAKY